MIEVCLSNSQRFFVPKDKAFVIEAIRTGEVIYGYVTSEPGETSKLWYINPKQIAAFSEDE